MEINGYVHFFVRAIVDLVYVHIFNVLIYFPYTLLLVCVANDDDQIEFPTQSNYYTHSAPNRILNTTEPNIIIDYHDQLIPMAMRMSLISVRYRRRKWTLP